MGMPRLRVFRNKKSDNFDFPFGINTEPSHSIPDGDPGNAQDIGSLGLVTFHLFKGFEKFLFFNFLQVKGGSFS